MTLIKSIYDKDFYNDLLKNQRLSKAILYWVGISFFVVVSTMIYGVIFFKNNIPIFIEESIPYFSIEDGILQIDKPVYLGVAAPTDDIADINFAYEGIPVVIDPNFEFKEEEFRLFPNFLVATRDRVYLKGSEGLEVIEYSQIDWLENTNRDELFEKLKSTIPELKEIFIPITITFIFLFAIISIGYLISSFWEMNILALIGLLFSSIFKKDLKYKDILKITFYSRTLPLLLLCVLIISAGKFFSFIPVLIHIVLLGYFISSVEISLPKQDVAKLND